MDYRLALITGVDIPIPALKAVLHQPTIKEISMIGEKIFFSGVQYLCISKESMNIEDENNLSNVSNFKLLMMVMEDEKQQDKKQNVIQILSILFPNYSVIFSPRAILLNKDGENIIIDEGNFNILQAIIKDVFCLATKEQDSFNPANDAAKKIADKIMRGRKIAAEQKAKAEGDHSVFTQYLSILCVGLHISILDLIN